MKKTNVFENAAFLGLHGSHTDRGTSKFEEEHTLFGLKSLPVELARPRVIGSRDGSFLLVYICDAQIPIMLFYSRRKIKINQKKTWIPTWVVNWRRPRWLFAHEKLPMDLVDW